MNWANVRLIFGREVRDQLRDRRTLFMIAVLPLLLYPLLGMSLFQVTHFMRAQATRVLVVGGGNFDGFPPLVEGKRFSGKLFNDSDNADLLEVTSQPQPADAKPQQQDPGADARLAVQQGAYDVVLYFPPDFVQRLEKFQQQLRAQADGGNEGGESLVPNPVILHSSAKERSQIANLRVSDVIHRWTEQIGQQNLRESHLPATAAKPFDLKNDDVSEVSTRKAAMWSKILPFVLLLWALTGAFYPAVDLCAGEKERGTLETLLSSPAERSEIVWGKLLTVMLFSMATAVLNLLSMGITGSFILSQLPNFGPPPPLAIVWLLLALAPMSALFSALCLALAAFARSTKEGQYYLMPLVLITMPLTILPMAPGVDLSLGNCLIPITGVVLLLRAMLEGNYLEALPYIPLVTGVTLACCLFAVRWASDQFNRESVLFRESERLDVGLWLRHLMRDREDTPSVAQAVFCGMTILLLQFFMGFALQRRQLNLATTAAISQLVVVATPALLMTIMFTRSPRKTLLLRMPNWTVCVAALVLAVFMHPLARGMQEVVTRLYPISEPVKKALAQLMGDVHSGWLLVLLGILPAICEELAFRGFILSGLRHLGHKWQAIIISSIFFGVTHTIFQQSLIACLLGMLIGFLAVQTGSLLAGMLFHMTHNMLALLASGIDDGLIAKYPLFNWLVEPAGGSYMYRPAVMILSALAALAILMWFRKLPYAKTSEETLQEAIEHQTAPSVAV